MFVDLRMNFRFDSDCALSKVAKYNKNLHIYFVHID